MDSWSPQFLIFNFPPLFGAGGRTDYKNRRELQQNVYSGIGNGGANGTRPSRREAERAPEMSFASFGPRLIRQKDLKNAAR
jgi:hypothetical protein